MYKGYAAEVKHWCADGAYGRPINKQLLDKFNLDIDEWECLSLDDQEEYERLFLETNIEGLERVNQKYFGRNKYQIQERQKPWEELFIETFSINRREGQPDMGAELLLGIIICITVALTLFS